MHLLNQTSSIAHIRISSKLIKSWLGLDYFYLISVEPSPNVRVNAKNHAGAMGKIM